MSLIIIYCEKNLINFSSSITTLQSGKGALNPIRSNKVCKTNSIVSSQNFLKLITLMLQQLNQFNYSFM